jgi:uncharacterized membrane protein (UPF0127 family)
MRLRRPADGVVVCERVSMGDSFSERFMGLMGRASLAEDSGLWLRTSSIHMMFMRFPIDALFVGRIDAGGSRRVVAMREHLRPWRGIVLPIRGADAVIELPAGSLARHGVAVDDRLILEAADSGAEQARTS